MIWDKDLCFNQINVKVGWAKQQEYLISELKIDLRGPMLNILIMELDWNLTVLLAKGGFESHLNLVICDLYGSTQTKLKCIFKQKRYMSTICNKV